MPGRRKPTNVLEASGAFKKNPKRKKEREGEPQCTDPLGEAPDYFTAQKIQIWDEIKRVAPPDVLFSADTFVLEATCHLIADMRNCPEKFTAAMYAQLSKYSGMLGLSPEARTRLKINGSKKKEEESEFFS